MSFNRSLESYCNDGSVLVCFGISGDNANREGLLTIASVMERFMNHASNRKLIPKINMLLDTFGRGDHSMASNVIVSGQASIDGNIIDMAAEFRVNRRLNERQQRLVRSYITSYLFRDAFDTFVDTIGEMIFEGSLYVAHEELVLIDT